MQSKSFRFNASRMPWTVSCSFFRKAVFRKAVLMMENSVWVRSCFACFREVSGSMLDQLRSPSRIWVTHSQASSSSVSSHQPDPPSQPEPVEVISRKFPKMVISQNPPSQQEPFTRHQPAPPQVGQNSRNVISQNPRKSASTLTGHQPETSRAHQPEPQKELAP